MSMLLRVDTCLFLFAGVIILSAVLKRRMILADKAKSMFISKYPFISFSSHSVLIYLDSISHELRTPLHGVRFVVTFEVLIQYLTCFTDSRCC
jgi:signal transduction histidine kinase